MEENVNVISPEIERNAELDEIKEKRAITIEDIEALSVEPEKKKAESESAEAKTEGLPEGNKPKKKRQIALKIVSTLFYLIITAASFVIEIYFANEAITLLSMPELGFEGLAFIIILPALLIIPIIALVFYLIPFILSIVGFSVSFKRAKNGAKRQGRIDFPVQACFIVVSETILVILTAATFIAVQLK